MNIKKITRKEDLIRFIDLLEFIKRELRLESLFLKDPFSIYDRYRTVGQRLEIPFWNKDKIKRPEDRVLTKIGEINHSATLGYLNDLLSFLYSIDESKLEPIKGVRANLKFSWERVRSKITLIKFHLLTLGEVIKEQKLNVVKGVLRRSLLLLILASLNKLIVYPIYVILFFLKKPNNWRVKITSIKLRCQNLYYFIKAPLYSKDKIILSDRIKEVLFNITLSLPLRLILGYTEIGKDVRFKVSDCWSNSIKPFFILAWEFILPILSIAANGLINLLGGSEPAYCMPPTRQVMKAIQESQGGYQVTATLVDQIILSQPQVENISTLAEKKDGQIVAIESSQEKIS
jgi:hypothetical protein